MIFKIKLTGLSASGQTKLQRMTFKKNESKSFSIKHPKSCYHPILSGVACINPPMPPPENHLVVQYSNNTVIPFGGTVTYTCEYSFFFEENYDLKNFTLTCLNDGNFTLPLTWKKCLSPSSMKIFLLLLVRAVASAHNSILKKVMRKNMYVM